MGKKNAPSAEEVTPQIIITHPLPTLLNNGTNLNKQEIATEIKIILAIGFESRAGGIIIAINIAYNAIPSADIIVAGRMLLAKAPKTVPPTQPQNEQIIIPNI